jgi:hypothetical protein
VHLISLKAKALELAEWFLPSKREPLSSNPSTAMKIKKHHLKAKTLMISIL